MILAALAATLAMQGWTWTLYEGDGSLVLANELPDTPQLQAVLECRAGSGVARVDIYGVAMGTGFATLTSGQASASAETTQGAGKQSVAVRVDHPVFSQFISSGVLRMTVAESSRDVAVAPSHLAKLRRFAELCSG